MKKIIIYILVSIIINALLISVTQAYATQSNAINHAGKVLVAERKYEPAVIPKPDTLPGPDAATQTGKDGKLVTLSILTGGAIPRVTAGLIGFVAMTSLLMLIVAGVRFVVSYGNDEAVGKAKNEVIYAIVGLLIAMLAYVIVMIIVNIKIEPLK